MSEHPAAPLPSPLAIYALTPVGLLLARRIRNALGGEVFAPQDLAGPEETGFTSLPGAVASAWGSFRGHVLVGPVGVAVRCVAPLLRHKGSDPAVAAVDQAGNFAVSVLSGHLGGANRLTRELARVAGGQAVVTTGTDVAGLPAVDELAAGLGMAVPDLEPAKRVGAALLAGRTVQLFDPDDRLGLSGRPLFQIVAPEDWDADRPGVWCDCRVGPAKAFACYPACLFLGMGCRRGTPAKEMVALAKDTLADRGLARESLAGLGTVEDKRDEPGLTRAARELGLEIRYFSRSELDGVAAPNPSETVRRHLGVDSVCEAAAMLMAGVGTDRLLVTKVKGPRATLAAACSRP